MSGRWVFLIGHPLGHSFSPAMQNAALRHWGLPWRYVPIDLRPSELTRAFEVFREPHVIGGNVTVPYKEDIIPLLDGIEGGVRELGSVNTVHRKGRRLIGASTDGEGFLRSLGPWRGRLKGTKGLVVGAGGSARAVAMAMAGAGAKEILIANRTWSKARALSRSIRQGHPRTSSQGISLREGEKVLKDRDWVVQTTSVGLRTGDPSPLSLRSAAPGTLVVDLLYHRETAFLRQAKAKRLPALSGLGMLLHQGALSLELWTGRKAPLGIMREALLACLSKKG